MKPIILALLVALIILALLEALSAPATNTVIKPFYWEYPVSGLSTNYPVAFLLYSSDTVTGPWKVFTNISLSHPSLTTNSAAGATNQVTFRFMAELDRNAAGKFFIMSATNAWWESDFSNARRLPEVPPPGSRLRLIGDQLTPPSQ